MSTEGLLALTDQIYDAAAGGTGWASVGLGLSGLLRARSASLMVSDGRQAELLFHTNIPVEAVDAYRSRYRAVDLWTARAAHATASWPPRIWTSGTLVPEREFLRSEFYGDFGRHHGLRYVVGTVLPLGEAGSMPIGLHRPEGADPFASAEAALLEAVLPHLRRAVQLRRRLAPEPAAAAAQPGLAALDGLAMPVLVVDAELVLLAANLAAEALLAEGAALRLVARPGLPGATRVLVGHRDDTAALRGLVRATALGGGAGGAVRLRDAGGQAGLAALVAPLPSRVTTPDGAPGRVPGQALLLLRAVDAAPPAPAPGLLRDLFGLSRAEAEIAIAMAGASSKGAVAAARGLRETTVRTQVRAVLAKTGTANLRELAALLAALQGPALPPRPGAG
jgi:DNA-binding CsgD family transcriptional regulator